MLSLVDLINPLLTLTAMAVAFGVTFYLVPHVIAIALRYNIVDNPDGKLKNHARPTAYLGGVALYVGFLCSLALLFPFEGSFALFFIGITLLFFVGLLDDLRPLSPLQKFGGQILAAICFLKAGLYLKEHFFTWRLGIPLSFLWILTVINAFNLVDIMDGLAATISFGAALSCMAVALYFGEPIALFFAALIGALAAFFYYNKPQAHIYLGDAGSLFLGGVFAASPFLLPWSAFTVYGFLAPIIILGIPLLELLFLIIIRTKKGIPFYLGSPDHFAIILQRRGWSKYQILGGCLFLSSLFALVAFLFLAGIVPLSWIVLLGAMIAIIWGLFLYGK
jgi:UDP-GlcNAc:undecaprenyl-phosphate GlcNAc-1-phosphate transferase